MAISVDKKFISELSQVRGEGTTFVTYLVTPNTSL
jgi:hypothetical protein